MSGTSSDPDDSVNHIPICVNTTRALLDEEQHDRDDLLANLNIEAHEQYKLLVELQEIDEEYNEVLKVNHLRKLGVEKILNASLIWKEFVFRQFGN